jgi:hypothetical protein
MQAACSMNQLDQIIDATMASRVYADACRRHATAGWIVMRDLPEYADQFVARLVTDTPSPYLLIADTLGQLHAQLPIGLEIRLEPAPTDPAEVMEIWISR